jgi:DNA-binding NarL/FixJ family response regulator
MKVLLIDDHPLILAALQTVIRGLGDDVMVMGVGNERDARLALREDPDFDLVLLDLSLGDTDGFEVLADLRNRYPALPVVIVSATERSADVIRAIDMGAMGFVPKRSSNRDLFEALRMVMSGGVYIPPLMLGNIETAALPLEGDTKPDVMRKVADEAEGGAGGPPAEALDALGLTGRQAAVLALLLQGMPNKLIARELGVTVETVKDHVAAVLRALGVNSRTQAVLAVSQMLQSGNFQTWRPTQR